MKIVNFINILVDLTVLLSCQTKNKVSEQSIQVSGIYSQLAYYNNKGECGTGAVAPWMLYKEVTVKSGKTFNFVFPENFEARWIRFVSNKNCIATTLLTYN